MIQLLAIIVSCIHLQSVQAESLGDGWQKRLSEQGSRIQGEFVNPPDTANPGVYWYFMDGNMSREGITADLESMKHAGIGSVLVLEVNIGVPRGPVDFMSEVWQENFAYIVEQAERFDIDVILGSGPGWTGTGGPWVRPEDSMQVLRSSRLQVTGPGPVSEKLPIPAPAELTPWSGLSDELAKIRDAWFQDVAVLAFPTPQGNHRITDLQEKALFARWPYTSYPGVKPFLPLSTDHPSLSAGEVIDPESIIDLTDSMRSDGSLDWDVPEGNWTVVRFAARSTGQTTRPAPMPGYGLESNKLSRAALKRHYDAFTGKLKALTGDSPNWTRVHFDSWEMGAQNWTNHFAREFRQRRGYDLMPYLPAYHGMIVGSWDITERFLWDLRKTCQELVLENHAEYYKTIAHQNGWELSIQPYDMNFAGDLDLGAVADIPSCEFWSVDGFDSVFSCLESVSVAHTMGKSRVFAEAFTTNPGGGFKHYPGSLKNQTDWAFAMGINGIMFHTYPHQPLGEGCRPGMSMGPFGIHWQRHQTFWPMVSDYHRYLSRCSHILRQGVEVVDILYLVPEGVPNVFLPPATAMEGTGHLRDKKGYRFDAVSERILMARAKTQEGKISFAGGTSYSILVLPALKTMTPALLGKIKDLVEAGAVVIGSPPVQSPSLSGYPACDTELVALAKELWGGFEAPATVTSRSYGKGRLYWGGAISEETVGGRHNFQDLYPDYELTAHVLRKNHIHEDFSAAGPVRFTHRRTETMDIYFVSNRSDKTVDIPGTFRVRNRRPELWHPLTGQTRPLPEYLAGPDGTSIPLRMEPYESYFVVFRQYPDTESVTRAKKNFPAKTQAMVFAGPWEISFDPDFGGPESVTMETLRDWTDSEDPGIKYYSGIAVYRKTFDLPPTLDPGDNLFLDLGVVHDIARIRMNGTDLGTVWTAPWRIRLGSELRQTDNLLEIHVANTWINRLVGDEQPENKNRRSLTWDNGMLEGRTYSAGRYTFTTQQSYTAETSLTPAGLLGPVTLLQEATAE